jgi:hypothetical protein
MKNKSIDIVMVNKNWTLSERLYSHIESEISTH